MSIKNSKFFSELEILDAIKNSDTMGGAAKVLNVDWRTFKKRAEKYGLYKPTENRSGKKFDINDIFG